MSDTAAPPPPSAPAPAPAPQAAEVPINQNPVNTPAPVGQQAPPLPEVKGSEHRPKSRSEAIQAAFDRASNPPPKAAKPAPRAAPAAAEAKPGHNQPPEETEKFDLKKRPSEQPQAQPRSERGQFAPESGDLAAGGQAQG